MPATYGSATYGTATYGTPLSGALPATVAVELGFGSPPGSTSPTWTDVSDRVLLDVGDLEIVPGRSPESDALAPRSLRFTLDNRDDRFNPRNTSGPYYGNLKPRVPVRVRVNYAGVTRTLFRGFVDGGWPQDLLARQEYVTVSALDAAGYLAQTPAPETAFEVAARGYVDAGPTPASWLKAQSSGGWIDVLSGGSVTASSVFETTDPVIDGETASYGTAGRDGYGVSQTPNLFAYGDHSLSAHEVLVTAWVRLEDQADGSGMVVYELRSRQPAVGGAPVPYSDCLRLFVGVSAVTFQAGNLEGAMREGSTNYDGETPTALMDGRTHFLALWVRLPSAGAVDGDARLWIDGEEAVVGWNYVSTTNIAQPDRLGIGGDPYQQSTSTRFAGVIDHVIGWDYVEDWVGTTVDQVVADLYDAGRIARAGDTLDERLSWLLDAVGWDHVGTLDASGIVTRKAYGGGGTALELAQTIEATEQGRVWVDNEGRVRFSQRSWAWTDPTSSAVQVTFTDNPAELNAGTGFPYLADRSVLVDDDRRLVNVAKVNRQDGRDQVVESPSSIATYGRRNPANLDGLLYSTDKQSRSVAEWIVYSRSTPTPRVDRLAFAAHLDAPTLVPAACQIEPGWLVRTKRGSTTLDAHVLDVGHRIGVDRWEVELVLDGSRAGRTWFEWGTSTWGGPDGWSF